MSKKKQITRKIRGMWLKDPNRPRNEETIGGGFFVFRRGSHHGRIKPAAWPFEYATADAATAQAQRLAADNPGFQFDVVAVIGSHKADAIQKAEAA